MAQPRAKPSVPERDADGRIVSLTHLVGFAAGGTVLNVVALLVIDGLIALIGLSDFGRSTGWLAVIVPTMIYVEDFRAWAVHRERWLVAPVALVIGVGVGLGVVALIDGLPPLVSGAVGALVAVLVYAPVWFLGIRRLTGVSPVSAGPAPTKKGRR